MSQEIVKIIIRKACLEDKPKILSMLASTSLFRNSELKVAEEVFDDAINEPDDEYKSFVAEENGQVEGWICFGPAACTEGTYDIHWLVVTPLKQHNGVGTSLIRFAEDFIRNTKGRLITIETSSTHKYKLTRQFYEKLGYSRKAIIEQFYTPEDDKVVYAKAV